MSGQCSAFNLFANLSVLAAQAAKTDTTEEGGPLATARGCRPPIYISTKRSIAIKVPRAGAKMLVTGGDY